VSFHAHPNPRALLKSPLMVKVSLDVLMEPNLSQYLELGLVQTAIVIELLVIRSEHVIGRDNYTRQFSHNFIVHKPFDITHT
jgi:hypothetical protein